MGSFRATRDRLDILPDVPTIAETVPGYESSGWQGVAAPKNTPAAIIGRLNTEVDAALADRDLKARYAELGSLVLPGSPADFGKLMVDETQKWASVIQAAGIEPE